MTARTCQILLFMLLGALLESAAAEPLKIAAVGDIMLAGRYPGVIARFGFDYPFAATTGMLQGAHLAIGNLETPLTAQGTEFRTKRFRFRAVPENAKALQLAGFSVLTLANNHMLDFGPTGLADTLSVLNREEIVATGAGANLVQARKPAMISRAGKDIAILAYSLTQPTEFFATSSRAGTAPAFARYIDADIRAARRQADLVIVSFHWGNELETIPRQSQRTLAHLAIDAGATIVLGHHPHVLQGIEFYGAGVICYSLGNFTFGSASRTAKLSMIALLTVPDTGQPELEIIPLSVDNRASNYQPRPLAGNDAAAAIAGLQKISLPLGTSILHDGRRYRAMRNIDPKTGS